MVRGKRLFISLIILALASAFFMGLAQRFRREIPGKAPIAILRLEGPILDVRWHMEEVRKLSENSRIKGVILRIDSPGGAVAPTQELYRELTRLREVKPVVTSMGTIAASGGYYLSCATDWIVCNPGTLTGSVGVIMEFTNLRALFDKIGVDIKTIKSGKFKDVGNPAREMTPEEESLLKEMILDTYEQFVQAVLEGRNLDEEAVRPYFDGRILTGRQALQIGLVDELGNINDAIVKVVEMAGLPEVPEEFYEPERDRPGLIRILMGRAVSQALEGFARDLQDSGDDRWLQLWRVF
ncbi:MAG: signal peptide peptidase SppA [Proteobacteria bacterium]|nr:signal peptide peptidase SppA [Pseudomonadota bacterium]